jgi:hypothetical protein
MTQKKTTPFEPPAFETNIIVVLFAGGIVITFEFDPPADTV